ncbi:acetylcholine receptor subunit beta-type acr-2-like [Ruditapes philippinarum]|uniref:acetylcholine receptor subunit beta-type acr-2-like n=1 Tax=Ruditapes philippinarum TaxID=129788 RepID=UPI00295B917E|nr:acetylcholine receptor subunit beta-type acr-2-like [Ruditapes philippinarum]
MENKPREGYFLVTFVVFLLLANCHGCYGASSGHEIWDYLFLNGTYNNEVRPVKDWGTPTHVNVSVAVIAVVDFNEVKQTIILTSKLTIVWKDEYLVWDPLNFGNITHIHVLQSKVWKPYLFLENSVSKQPDMGSPSVNLIVSHEGVVEWNPVEVFKSTCAADVRKFPFDTQKCSMVFETQGYTNQEIEIHSVEDHIDFHGYGITSGWYVEDTDIETKSENGAEIHILCSLTLRRNPTYFILNIFLPIVLLSFMNLCVFILPVQSGEKASFVITVFLSLAVFLTIVSSNLPENTDNVSILNIYVCICTLLSVIIAFLTIIQIRLYHRDSNMPIPPLLLKLVILFTSKGRRIHKGSTDTIPNKAVQKQQKKNIIDVIPLDDTIRDDKNKDVARRGQMLYRHLIIFSWWYF